MNSIDIITLSIGLMAASLIMVSLINRFQTRNRIIKQKTQFLRRRISDLEELCASVEPLLESVIIPQKINEEIIQLIQTVKRLEPTATYLEVHLEQAHQLAKEFANDRRTQPMYRLMSSDAAIAKGKFFLTESAKVIRRQHTLGAMLNTEMEELIRELSWAHLMVDVISHIGHGHKAVSREDPVVAYSFYRKAQNMLINANQDEQRRHRYIRELSEVLNNKRVALSLELMPESNFNPSEHAMQLPQDPAPIEQQAQE